MLPSIHANTPQVYDSYLLSAGIPVGDLFVSMESWDEPERIKASMDVILEIEAEAAQRVSGKEGLVNLLKMLQQYQVRGVARWNELGYWGCPWPSSIKWGGDRGPKYM